MSEVARNSTAKDLFGQSKLELEDGKPLLRNFSRYLDAKLHPSTITHIRPSHASNHPAEVVNNLLALRLRRNKMVENNSESRFNRLLKDFKQLDTYVDIRSFIKDMNVVNQGVGPDELPAVPQHPEKVGAQADVLNQDSYSSFGMNTTESNFKGLLEKVNLHFSSEVRKRLNLSKDTLGILITELQKQSDKATKNIDEPLQSIDIQAMLAKPIVDPKHFRRGTHEVEEASISQSKKVSRKFFKSMDELDCEKKHMVSPLRSNQIDKEYETDFNNKISTIQSKLFRTLAHMHSEKWEKARARSSSKRKHRVEDYRQKPWLNEKYRKHAPKGFFEFRETTTARKRPAIRSRVYDNSLKTEPCQESVAAESGIKKKWAKRRHNLTEESPSSNKKILKQLNTIKENYHFKKPLIKQTILHKLVDFIQQVETKQHDFRKENIELCAGMNRYEQSKRLQFDKFLDEKLEIDTVEVRSLVEKFKLRC